uniref:Putative secreted protein n=1 Tax=Anopheles darlingi TaxID=43151 RepID=A0A2M4DMC5_ANODA
METVASPTFTFWPLSRAASLLYLSIKCSRFTPEIALTGMLIAFWQLKRYVFIEGSSISCLTAVWCCS